MLFPSPLLDGVSPNLLPKTFFVVSSARSTRTDLTTPSVQRLVPRQPRALPLQRRHLVKNLLLDHIPLRDATLKEPKVEPYLEQHFSRTLL